MTQKNQPKKISLKRDSQQWAFDWIVKETGKLFHFQSEGRGRIPRSVRSHDMISKHMGQAAIKLEKLAKEEEAAGHVETAVEIYFQAALQFLDAQHVIFENNDEKKFLHSSLIRNYSKVRELVNYRIEHIDIPWNGTTISGNLHLALGDGPKPLVFYVPGCDQTKESWPHPYYNQALKRGMHLFCFDGPGQGECNMRSIPLTSDNYEKAASAAIDYLIKRPEVDPKKIGVYALSFGSHWGMRIAATDHRIAAVVAPWASYVDKHHLMNEESPRYKQLFAYLTKAKSEAELDKIVDAMTMNGFMEKIKCPSLLIAGEYDPRAPIDEVYELFDQMKAPAELWVMSDQHHIASITHRHGGSVWEADIHGFSCDWLRDRFNGQPLKHAGQVLYLDASGSGPNAEVVKFKRKWYE